MIKLKAGDKCKQIKYHDLGNPECIITKIEINNFTGAYIIYHKHEDSSGVTCFFGEKDIETIFQIIGDLSHIKRYGIVDFCSKYYK